MSIAAGFLLFVGGIWLYNSQYAVKAITLSTNNQIQTSTLPDGSVITLNRKSLFEYPSKFKGNQREVKLKNGEAFFNITHNKAKPFIISAGNTLIRVVGTSFNVKNKKDGVEVIVESGIVQVSRNGQSALLKPGEKILVKQNSKTLEKEINPDQLYTYYRSKKFIADDTPLWRVVEVLNEAYDSHIVIGKKELNNLPLNTTFQNESLDKILDVISRTFKITVERKNGSIILK
jgi:ferric-dicitrate binding protein FerR (iron transport regulator)